MDRFSKCTFIATLVCLPLMSAIAREGKPVILRGQVVNYKAEPVVGAEVVAYEKYGEYYHLPDYAKMLTAVQITDSDGKFYVNVMPTSQYDTYVVARNGRLAIGWDALSYSHDDKAEGNFHIVLEKPHTLAGKVVDTDGMPIAEATVQVLPKTSYLSRLNRRPLYGPEEWFTVKTNDKGDFAFRNLPADASGDFWVTVPGCDLSYHYSPHTTSSIGYEVGIEDLKLVLPRGTTIRGKVVEKETRKGISGVLMLLQIQNLRDKRWQRYRDHELVSGEDGEFLIRGVPAGRHTLKVVTPFDRIAEWIANTMTLNVTGIEGVKNVKMGIEKGAVLEVSVRNRQTGQSLNGIQTFVSKKSARSSKGNSVSFLKVFTGADGFARVRVLPGRYTIQAYDHDYIRPQGSVPVIARLDKTSRLAIMLEPRRRVRGTVLEVSGRPASRKITSIYPFGHTVFTDHYGKFEAKPNNQHPAKFFGVRDVERNLAGLVKVTSRSSISRLSRNA